MNKSLHTFQSPKADGADATLVQPSDWNADHRIGIELTNRTGGQVVSGDVVGLSAANDESVVLADTLDTTRSLVVALETIANLAVGLFTSVGAWTVRVAGATTRGNYLAKSATSLALYDTGVAAASNPPPLGAVAIALTGSGGAGTVVGFLLTSGAGGGGFTKGADIASAAALNVGTSHRYFHITGTTTVTSISTRPAGDLIALEFDAALTITHAAGLFLQAEVNYVTAAGDVLFFVSEGSGNWRQIAPEHAALTYLQLGTNPSASGAVRLANAGNIKSRNAANNGDVEMLRVDASDRVVLGPGSTANIVVSGQLRADIESTARIVAPVGTDKWAV